MGVTLRLPHRRKVVDSLPANEGLRRDSRASEVHRLPANQAVQVHTGARRLYSYQANQPQGAALMDYLSLYVSLGAPPPYIYICTNICRYFVLASMTGVRYSYNVSAKYRSRNITLIYV